MRNYCYCLGSKILILLVSELLVSKCKDQTDFHKASKISPSQSKYRRQLRKLWLLWSRLSPAQPSGFPYRMDLPVKLTLSAKSRDSGGPGSPPPRPPPRPDCSHLFQAFPPARTAQPGRLKSQRKSACLHPIRLCTATAARPQLRTKKSFNMSKATITNKYFDMICFSNLFLANYLAMT